MIKGIKDIIDIVFIESNYNYLKKIYKRNFDYKEELYNQLSKFCEKISVNHADNSSTTTFYLTVNVFLDEKFSVEYHSILNISKVANVYYLEHSFSIDNVDPNRMTPVLDGFGGEAYSKQQYELEEFIINLMDSVHYMKLEYKDIDEVISEVVGEVNTLYLSSQITLRELIFDDRLGVLDNIDNL